MPTMEVPQKKKGEMSSSSASSCAPVSSVSAVQGLGFREKGFRSKKQYICFIPRPEGVSSASAVQGLGFKEEGF